MASQLPAPSSKIFKYATGTGQPINLCYMSKCLLKYRRNKSFVTVSLSQHRDNLETDSVLYENMQEVAPGVGFCFAAKLL